MDLLVSTDWLAENIDRDDVKILDGTWAMPGETIPLQDQYIPKAQFFDIDHVADLSSPLKHMLPSPAIFAAELSRMCISHNDHIIIYDRHGFRAAPRLWWTCRVFGHENVSILDGGLPSWIQAGHNVTSKPFQPEQRSDYIVGEALSGVVSMNELQALLPEKIQMIDARSAGRFYGTEPEPRAGLRSGHIPGSLNLPFTTTRTEDMRLRDMTELAEVVGAAGVDLSKPIITTCGSGITAAALAFIFYALGAIDVNVYDGSWAEWGASNAPIEI